MGELLSSRMVAAALTARRRARRSGWTRAAPSSPTTSTRGPRRWPAKPTPRCAPRSAPAIDAGRVPVLGGFVGATRRRAHDDARPRRLRLLRRARRRRHRRARDSDLDRRGRHADRRSARRRRRRAWCRGCRSPRRPSWPTSAPRCCTRARSCRPSSATSRCASSTRGEPEGDGHAHHRARRRPTARRSTGAGLQARRDRDRHHLEPDADGLRLPAPGVRGVRALPHGGGRGDDVRGQRVGDRGRSPPPRRDRRGAVGVRRGVGRVARWRCCAPWATGCATSRRSRRASSACSKRCRCG